mmetsp:Transcript_25973/g.72510  ORF Transcript_25973/g.72510 Transcript_25973/m.72510 type:complete len:384 (-) Transcript_25973:225-1376(-)
MLRGAAVGVVLAGATEEGCWRRGRVRRRQPHRRPRRRPRRENSSSVGTCSIGVRRLRLFGPRRRVDGIRRNARLAAFIFRGERRYWIPRRRQSRCSEIGRCPGCLGGAHLVVVQGLAGVPRRAARTRGGDVRRGPRCHHVGACWPCVGRDAVPSRELRAAKKHRLVEARVLDVHHRRGGSEGYPRSGAGGAAQVWLQDLAAAFRVLPRLAGPRTCRSVARRRHRHVQAPLRQLRDAAFAGVRNHGAALAFDESARAARARRRRRRIRVRRGGQGDGARRARTPGRPSSRARECAGDRLLHGENASWPWRCQAGGADARGRRSRGGAVPDPSRRRGAPKLAVRPHRGCRPRARGCPRRRREARRRMSSSVRFRRAYEVVSLSAR